ncbi:HlyC/CorC family transporter [Weissella coleopterorum]|uniref:HlyC/CorC family transporter n=1 Tax=Weissella coleopterorum TaxID=2714949 RepID=A0A6G8AY98_9LACO|nr:hemolysin family protein [Weissella coleopterorum]QIL49976.1 HlyC/CorC family transporter [Weissella coleopterorum]
MDSASIIYNLIAIVVILLLAVLFTLTEYSLVKVRPSALKAMADAGEGKPSRNLIGALHMTEHLTEYLSTAQVGITLTSLILGWIGEAFIAALILSTKILPENLAHPVASVGAILIFTFIHAVFTDLVPKNIAIDKPVRTLLLIVRPVRFFHVILYPLIYIFDRTAATITKLLGFNAHPDEEIYSQNEIISLSEDAAQAGELDAEDVAFMKRAFEMNDKVAADIMIDRTQLDVVDVTATIGDAVSIYLEDKFSRLPVVANNDKDKILGYVFSYDLVRQMRINPEASVRIVLRNIPNVSENQDIQDILEEMITHRAPIVVVKDEYGGTSGIVTDKDIYEELFGTVRDEIDDVSDDLIEKIASDEEGRMHYKVNGKLTLFDFERYFKVEIKAFSDSEMVTLTGFVLDKDPDVSVGDEFIVSHFKIIPLDYKDAYINEFEVIDLNEDDIIQIYDDQNVTPAD